MNTENKDVRTVQLPMSPTAKRLVASIGSIPFLFGSFVVLGVAIETFTKLRDPFSVVFAPAALVAMLVWILIWRDAVAWSQSVIRQTIAAAFLLLVLPVSAQIVFWNSGNGSVKPVLACVPLVGWAAWMIVTLNRWPILTTGHAQDGPTPRCLRCGYRLTGLTSTRCPECGDEPTLDVLWQATTTEL